MLKKVLALAIAGAMVLGSMNLMAFAEEQPITQTITIGGLDEGDTVNIYKVLAWEADSQTGEGLGAVNGWYFVAPFNTDDEIADNGDLGKAYLSSIVNDQNQLYLTDEVAKVLAHALNGASVTPVNGNTPVAEANGVATYTLDPKILESATNYDGLYMAIITPADQDVVYNPVFVHIDTQNKNGSFTIIESSASYMNASSDASGNILGGAAKKSRINLTKEAENSDDYNGDDGDTTKPYDDLTFTVNTTIPGYGDTFDGPVFNLTDKLNGLKLAYPDATDAQYTDAAGETQDIDYTQDITVKVGNDTITIAAASDYDNDTFKITPAAGQYTIEFKEDFLKTLHVPTAVEITYHAIVQPGENTNVIKEKNTVTLEFSHDPTTEDDQHQGGDKQYKKDITNHYTFSIDANNLVGPDGTRIGESGSELIKVAVDKDNNPITSEYTWSNVGEPETNGQQSPLAGASFTLYGADESGNIDRTNIVGKATSDASGRINFTGLDEGKYFLEEDSAPAGYVKKTGQFPITITATMRDTGDITEYTTDGETWISEADYEALEEDDQADYVSYTYRTEELESYSITYGAGAEASSYTFTHAHESSDDVINWTITQSGELPQSIQNAQGVELPSTGGIGTTIFYAGGAMLVLLAGVLLVSKRRIA